MAALLLAPLFEAIGGTALATELLGTTLGTAASGAVVGAAGSKIDEEIAKRLPENVRTAPTKVKNDLLSTALSLYSQNPAYLIKQKQSGNSFFLTKQEKSNETNVVVENDITGKSIDNTQPNMEIQKEIKAPEEYTVKTIDKILNESNAPDEYKQLYAQLNKSDKLVFEESQAQIIDVNGNVIEEELNLEDEVYEAQYDVQTSSPRDLAQYIIDFSKQFANTLNVEQSIKNVVSMNPSVAGLSNKVNNFLLNSSIPDTEEFRQIMSVFNGEGITINSFRQSFNQETGLIEISGIDELGTAFILPQTTGLIIPAYPGSVFIGPRSPNNILPTGGLMDMFAFFHDFDYKQDGFFSHSGDLKFISRLVQNRDKFTQSKEFVNATIVYFSTVSLTLGQLKNWSNPQTSPYDNGDIFEEIGSPEALGLPEVDENTYSELKRTFYDVLDSELYEHSLTDGFFQEQKENYTEQGILNLNIQLN